MQLENKIYKIEGENGFGKSSWIHNYLNKNDLTNISYLPQTGSLYINLSILDNARLILTAEEIITFINNLEQLFIYDLNQKLKELSGGQQRKVEIAITLSKKSKIYIFDEPLNNLDLKSQQVVCNKIKELNNTVILVDHLNKIMFDEILNINKTKKRIKPKFKPNFKIFITEIKNNNKFINVIVLLFLSISVLFTLNFTKLGAIDYTTYSYSISNEATNNVDGIDCNYLVEPESGLIPIIESEDIDFKYQYIKGDNFIINNYRRYSLPLNLESKYGYAVVESDISADYFNDLVNNYHVFGVYKLKEGYWPRDNSNEIAIPYNLAKYFNLSLNQNIIYNSENYIISAIFINQVDSPQKVITSYKEDNNKNDECFIVSESDHTSILSESKNLIINLIIIIVINIFIVILIYRLIYENIKRQIIGFRNHQLLYYYVIFISIIYLLSNIIYLNTPT